MTAKVVTGAATALGCLLACARAPNSAGDAAPALPELVFAGCAGVHSLEGRTTCVLAPEPRLVLWLARPAPGLTVAADGRPVPLARPESLDEGVRHTIAVPAGASRLEVAMAGVVALRLALEKPPPQPEALARAQAARGTSGAAQAEADLQAALAGLEPRWRRRAGALLARYALDRADVEAAVAGLARSAADARAAGEISAVVEDATARAYVLAVNAHRFAEARRTLAEIAPLAGAFGEARARQPFYEAHVAARTGDLRAALRLFRAARVWGERLQLDRLRWLARQLETEVLARLGRAREALAAVPGLAATVIAPGACPRADAFSVLAWVALLSRATLASDPLQRSAAVPAVHPEPFLDEADRAAVACGDPFRRREASLNRALANLEQGRLAEVTADLLALDRVAGGRTGVLDAWELEARGRLALGRGDAAAAVRFFARQAERAEAADFIEGMARAQAARGRALGALGDHEQSLAAHREAERILDGLTARVPLGEGRVTFLGAYEGNARALVALLVRLGRLDEAMEAARRARIRPLAAAARTEVLGRLPGRARARWEEALARYLERRAAVETSAAALWGLPGQAYEVAVRQLKRERDRSLGELDEVVSPDLPPARGALREPERDELLLVTFPAEPGAWLLAQLAGERRALRVALAAGPRDAAGASPALAEALLAPIADMVHRARRLRVLSHRAFAAVDFHALTFEGAPLAEQRPVAYGLDLPVRSAPPPARAVLVAADPTGNLSESRREAREVMDHLGGPGTLLVGDDVTFERLRSLLPAARFFHFAGHGRAGTVDGLDAHLPLAGSAELTAADVLALPAVPPVVVLAACGAGEAGPDEAGDAGIGLARAFLLAGARAVIAPSGRVEDALARDFARALYGPGALRPDGDPVPALAAAQAALRAAGREGAAIFRAQIP